MSGDIPIEASKTEAETKPMLLTASASFDVYLQPETRVNTNNAIDVGVAGFVQECYRPKAADAAKQEIYKAEADKKTCDARAERERQFREKLEKSNIFQLRDQVNVQAQSIYELNKVLDSINDLSPEEKAKRLRGVDRCLRQLTYETSQYTQTCDAQKTANPVTRAMTRALQAGKVDLSKYPAELKFEGADSNFSVISDKQKLTIKTTEGSVTYCVKDGQIIENKNDKETPIGSADTRASYVYKDGTLQLLDQKENICSIKAPVFNFGGKGELDTSIDSNDFKGSVLAAGVSLDASNKARENTRALDVAMQKRAAYGDVDGGKKPGGCHNGSGDGKGAGDNCDGKGKGDGKGNGDGRGSDQSKPGRDPWRPGDGYGRNEPSYGGPSRGEPARDPVNGSASDYSNRSNGGQAYDQPVSRPSAPTQTVGQDAAKNVGTRPAEQIAQVIVPSRQTDIASLQPRQGVMETAVSLPQNYYEIKAGPLASARLEQIARPATSVPNAAAADRISDLSKLSSPMSQSLQNPTTQIGYNNAFHTSVNSLAKQQLAPNPNPNHQQQMFNSFAKPTVNGDPVAKSNAVTPYQSFSSALPGSLYKTANSPMNGKSLSEVQDSTGKVAVKNAGGISAAHFGGQPGMNSTGRRLADLISDKAPGAHTTLADKWTPIRAVAGGGAVGGDAGPFIPISGKIGGAGSSAGARGDAGSKSPEGARVQSGSNVADGGKKVEGIKQAEGVKSNGGSNVADGGKKVEGVKQAEGVKSNGGSNVADGGKKVEGVKQAEGIKQAEGVKANGGSNVADGGKKIEGVKQSASVRVQGGSSVADSANNIDSARPVGVKAIDGSHSGGGTGSVEVPILVGQQGSTGASVKGTRESKDEVTQGQEEPAAQKDPGFGYTPRRSPYTVRRGDTLESIARQRWGDERLAELIRTINLHRLNLTKVDGRVVLNLSAGDLLWLPSPIEAERFKKVCDIKGDGETALRVGFSV